jgi:thioredoxin reductase
VRSLRPLDDGRFELSLAAGGSLFADSVVLATGARPQRIYVQGEMEYWGRGVSFSAISHAPFFSGRAVAVIGAGPRAVNAVLTLIPLASKIYFVVSSNEELRHSPASERALSHPKVVVFRGWEVQQVIGDDFVQSLELVGTNGEIRSLEVEGVFVQLGLIPNSALVRDFVDLDEYGHVVVNERAETSVPGFFAAGDVTTVVAEQVPVSLGEGSKAGITAWTYLAQTGKV